jgi:hypothetical protein
MFMIKHAAWTLMKIDLIHKIEVRPCTHDPCTLSSAIHVRTGTLQVPVHVLEPVLAHFLDVLKRDFRLNMH